MSELPHRTADDSDATDARFSLRALLKTMAVVAVVAAVLGPILRQLESDQQRRLLTAWGLWLAGAVLWIGYQARRRFEAERLAGRIIVRLPTFDKRLAGMTVERRFLNGVRTLVPPVLGLALVSMVALEPPSASSPILTVLLYASCVVVSIGLLSRGVFGLWWQRSVRLCESGVLWDRTLLYWTHVIGHRWSDSVILHLRGSDESGAETEIQVPVPPERREMVEQLLETNAGHRPSVAAVHAGTIAATGGGRADSQRFIGKAINITGIILLGGVVFYVFASGSRGPAEFHDMLIVGVIAGAIIQMTKGKAIPKRAGAPLVRLYGRIGGWRSLAMFAVCVACYFVGTSYAWTRPWVARVTGLGCGFTLILSILPGEFTFFELRAGGVLYPGKFLWPWSSVRLIRWDPGGTGRLILSRGWRRIVARVPAEQRPAVDAVLTDKLRLPTGSK